MNRSRSASKRVVLDFELSIRRLVPHKKSAAPVGGPSAGSVTLGTQLTVMEETIMKIWSKPAVREQEVGLEVTSYLPAEIDVI